MQLDAIALQAVKGERTTISIAAITVAFCSVDLVVDLEDAVHREEILAGIGRMDLRDAQVDRVGVR